MSQASLAFIFTVLFSYVAALPQTHRRNFWLSLTVFWVAPLLTCHAVRPSTQPSEGTELVEFSPMGSQAQVKTVSKTQRADNASSHSAKANAAHTRKHHRTNLCTRLKEVDESETPLVEALKGMRLSCGATRGKSYLQKDHRNGQWSGYDWELLQVVADRGKFTFDLEWANGTATEGAYQEFVSSYDFVLDQLTESSIREEQKIFPIYGYLDASLVLMASHDEAALSGDTVRTILHKVVLVFSPYDGWVWLMFAISSVATGILYSILETPSGETEKLSSEDDRKIGNSVYISYLHLTTHVAYAPQTWPGKILVLSWTAISVVFLAGYTANLATILVMERESTTAWKSIDDAMKANARICVQAGSHAQRYMLSTYPGYSYLIGIEGFFGEVKNVASGKCDASIVWQMGYEVAVLKHEYNPKCLLYKVGASLSQSVAGWGTFVDYGDHCTVLLRDALHTIFQTLHEEGKLQELYRQALLKHETTLKQPCGEVNTDLSSTSLGLANMGGLFIFHAVGVIVAIAAYLACGRRTADTGNS